MSNGTAAEMPRYKCHKIVHALKIQSIVETEEHTTLEFEKPFAPIRLISGYERFKFQDSDGNRDLGYYVVYADGWRSWSPTKPFEEGYTQL